MSKEKTESDVAFIRALADLLQSSDLAEIEVEREYGEDDELKVRLSRYSTAAPPPAPAPAAYAVSVPAAAPAAAPAAPAPAAAAPAASSDPTQHPGCVTSPMVGTAYLAPEPGAEPFVRVGASVAAGQTLLIIEAMKTMNPIPAPRAGVLKKVLVGDASPVEYGAPLMIIE